MLKVDRTGKARLMRGKTRFWWAWGLMLGLVLALGWGQLRGLAIGNNPSEEQRIVLPPLQPHPFPITLSQWQQTQVTSPGVHSGNVTDSYFDQVKPTDVGYLVWSQFPITVYIEPPHIPQAQAWMTAAQQAVAEWQRYLPLALVNTPTTADISIQANRPVERPGQRVRSAETTYELYIDPENHLAHRCIVMVRPTQVPKYALAALRHELGHALGIWGHSPVATDALYFAQVAEPPPISTRDIQTLVEVYRQPTRLGWPLPKTAQ